MAYSLSPWLKPRFFITGTNRPLAGGLMYTYKAGTTDPATTYSDDAGTTNTNPIVLDSDGQCDLFLDDAVSYRIILKNSAGVTQFDKDRIASLGSTQVQSFNSIAALRLRSGTTIANAAKTLGYYSAGDGGGNSFYWDSTSTATDNAGTVIKPTAVSGAGRWLAVDTSYINVKQFGAVGDGVADDTTPIQAAVDSIGAAGGGTLSFPSGVYKTTSKVILPSNITIVGSGKILTTSTIAIEAIAKVNVRIVGMEIEGPGASVVPVVPEDGGINLGNVTSTNGCTDVLISGCVVHGFYTGISCRYGSGARVVDNEIYNFNLYGLMLSRNDGFFCSRNEIHDSVVATGTNAYCISATGASNLSSPQRLCTVTDNKLYGVPSWSAIMSHDLADAVISGNVIDEARNGIDVSVAAGKTITSIVIANNRINGTNTDTWSGAVAANSGIFIATGGTPGVDIASLIAVTGNIVSGFGQFNSGAQASAGILASNVFGCAISGNVITQPDGVATYVAGIYIGSQGTEISINGNVVKTTAKPPVQIANFTGSDICVVGNVLRAESTASAVRVENCTIDGLTVDGNRHNRLLSGYGEAGTNTIDGVAQTAPYGGRGVAAKLSQRVAGAAVAGLAAGATQTLATITMPGVVVGDSVAVGYGGQSAGVIVYGYVNGANTVRIELYNGTGGVLTKSAATVSVDAWKHS
ncbi:MAG: right-handed parallel beta-helix repeat-containing protein [Agitococcus sp.]|nr:right-handed parallel beta-helix repeat-containing protein [Agitococcus sp.]